jgi:hypothetical protein
MNERRKHSKPFPYWLVAYGCIILLAIVLAFMAFAPAEYQFHSGRKPVWGYLHK